MRHRRFQRPITTLVELRDVLEEKYLVEIPDRAAGRTEEQGQGAGGGVTTAAGACRPVAEASNSPQ
jgi:hypothetical protein